MINARAAITAAAVGTVLQVIMVVAGHTNPSVASLFAVGGMGLSLLAGVLYTVLVRGQPAPMGSLLAGGALAGGVCALLGILVSHLLGDVPASLLVLGTVSSVVTGAVGAALGRLIAGNAAAERL